MSIVGSERRSFFVSNFLAFRIGPNKEGLGLLNLVLLDIFVRRNARGGIEEHCGCGKFDFFDGFGVLYRIQVIDGFVIWLANGKNLPVRRFVTTIDDLSFRITAAQDRWIKTSLLRFTSSLGTSSARLFKTDVMLIRIEASLLSRLFVLFVQSRGVKMFAHLLPFDLGSACSSSH
ncbi:hypothetical protein Tco_0935034 [Tanacetum coccineum]